MNHKTVILSAAQRSRRIYVAMFLALTVALAPALLRAADLTVTPANVQMSADGQLHKFLRTAGTTILPGQTVYLDTTTGLEQLADNNAAAPAYKVEGIAVTSATVNQQVLVCYQDAKFKLGAAVVIGDTIWQSGTGGGLTKTAADNVTGMFVSVLGVAVSTTEMKFQIIRSDVVKP